MQPDEVEKLLQDAASQQVELWFEGDRLRFRTASGSLPDALRTALSEHKLEILTLLRDRAASETQRSNLSAGQQALWYLYQSNPSSASYNVAFTGRIISPVNLAALHNSFQALVDRHSVLRTTYKTEVGIPYLAISGYAPVHFEQVDTSTLSDLEIATRVRQTYLEPFDLENGPVFRTHLFTRAEQDHILLITMHHIAVDGWSVWVLLDELRQLYEANLSGKSASLPRPPATYQDFVTWQEETLTSASGETLWNYWQNQLVGNPPALAFPADFPHPPIQTTNGASIVFNIPVELTQQLKDLAKSESATLFMVLCTAFQILLHRYTGQEDFVTGLPTFGRNKAEFARIVGDFINMIPLRVDLSGDPTFLELLSRVKKLILGGLEHQDYPFARLVARLGGSRDASRSPLFQVTFDVQRIQSFGELDDLFTPGKEESVVTFGGMRLMAYPMPQQEGQFELGIQMVDSGGQLPGTLKYNTDLFTQATAQRIVRQYIGLLQSIVDQPSRKVSEYTLLTPDERQRLLVDWNQTQASYPDVCMQQLFEKQVQRTPEAVALVYENQSLTYAQLNARANQLARHLQNHGITAGQMVGIYLDRSPEMIVALLAVMKSGAVYIPMDPIFPPQRIASMIEDSAMAAIITRQSQLDTLPEYSGQFLLLDKDAPALDRLPETNLDLSIDPSSPVYVIFTSGSTGRPKGVQIPHRALVNFLTAMQSAPGIQPADVVAAVTTLSFDIAGLEIYLPLISGARLVILSNETITDGNALAAALDDYHVTILQAVPSTWRLLIETGWTGRPGMKMLSGGEPLPLPVAQQLLATGGELWNLYGPTETTIWSTIHRLNPQDQLVSIGRPIANTRIYILDNHLQPVPPGVAGTLYIGGDGLALGYLKRPELTAEKFIPDPFLPGERIYNTGDLARYLPDGAIECLGRADSQVKIRGYRIELGEIETVLSTHATIQQAVVTVREDIPGDKRLAAYYVARPGADPSARELRAFLKDRLPGYMLPSTFTLLESFPLTSNGKVNRLALPAPVKTGTESHKVTQPPTTAMEKTLAESWVKILNVNQVSVMDNFFDLGGHSLLAMRMVLDIQEKTGQRLEPAYLRFESLAQLAARLDAAVSRAAS